MPPSQCLQVLECSRKQKTFAVNLLFYSNGPTAHWKNSYFPLCTEGLCCYPPLTGPLYFNACLSSCVILCDTFALLQMVVLAQNCAGFRCFFRTCNGMATIENAHQDDLEFSSPWENAQPLSKTPWASWDISNAFLVSSTIKMEQKIRIMDTLLTDDARQAPAGDSSFFLHRLMPKTS